jgi:hypothetical protein
MEGPDIGEELTRDLDAWREDNCPLGKEALGKATWGLVRKHREKLLYSLAPVTA